MSIFNKLIAKRLNTGLKPYKEISYKMVFKQGALKSIMDAKGWETFQDVANALGFTRQYISQLDKSKGKVTNEVITRLAAELGNIKKNWWVHFDIIPSVKNNPNHQTYNLEKYVGKMPYSRYSTASELRKIDHHIETT